MARKDPATAGNPDARDGVSGAGGRAAETAKRGDALRGALARQASREPSGEPAPVRALAPEPDDLALVRQSLEGRPGAFDALVRRHGAAVHSYLTRMTGNPALADDLYQETFIRAFRHRARWRGEAPFASWLFAIARRTRLTALSRGPSRWEDELPEEIELATAETTPESEVVRVEQEEAVRKAVMALPTDMREVILLSRYSGLTYREIGSIVGASEEAVKLRAFRAMKKLAAALAEDSEDV